MIFSEVPAKFSPLLAETVWLEKLYEANQLVTIGRQKILAGNDASENARPSKC
jgi:hypothetical protein